MKLRLLIYCIAVMCGTVSAQIRQTFEADLVKINKAYAALKEAQFGYVYRFYADSASTAPVQSMKVNIGKYGMYTYTDYDNMKMLSDTSLTMVIDEQEKRISLFRQEITQSSLSAINFIDSASLGQIFESVTDISVKNNSGGKEYTLLFKDREYTRITFRINAQYLIQFMAVYLDKPEYNPEMESHAPTVMQMTCTEFRNKVSDKKVFDTRTYFKQFGNGKYILNDQYATYRLINLYESQK